MRRLGPPSENFSTFALHTVQVDPASLHRISRHESGEPYFGRSGANRFDDPDRRFGTCYFGLSVACAFAETILHDEIGEDGFDLALEQMARIHYRFRAGAPLMLADLTGASLKRLGGTGELSTILPYDLPQAWAQAVHAHPACAHGILYQSRHMNDQKALVGFERARLKLVLDEAQSRPLLQGDEWQALVHDFRIRLR